MRRLTPITRRWFGQSLGASLALAAPGRAALAHAGTADIRVRVLDFAFAPDPVEITAGDTVVWINEDLAPHTATARNGSWDTGRFEKGEEVRLHFDSPGTFEYYCIFHSHMTGSIVVQPKPDA